MSLEREDKEDLAMRKILSYANGYRELRMFKEALDELSTLPESSALRIEALQMRLAILVDAEDWPAAECAAKSVIMKAPNDPGGYVNLAFATRRAHSLSRAKEILAEASSRFPNTGIIHYNLACYLCQEKDLEAAKNRLVKAISMEPQLLKTAKVDEDLTALGDWLDNLQLA